MNKEYYFHKIPMPLERSDNDDNYILGAIKAIEEKETKTIPGHALVYTVGDISTMRSNCIISYTPKPFDETIMQILKLQSIVVRKLEDLR